MSQHSFFSERDGAWSDPIIDPLNAGAIGVLRSGVCELTTGASNETRSLAVPAFLGQQIMLTLKTDGGGDCTITVASAYNAQGDTTIVLNDAGDFAVLVGVKLGDTLAWRAVQQSQRNGFIPIPLNLFREASNFDVGNIAANGGILASDTTPVLDAINAATDGCQRLLWAASNGDQIVVNMPLPPQLDTGKDLVLHARIVSAGTTDAVGFTVDTFFNEGDTKVVDTTGTNQTATWAEVTATIAAADIPAGAQTITIGLTPVAHTTNTMAMSACWLEYKEAA